MGIDDGSHVLVNGTPVGPAIGQYSDNQTEYKPGGTLPAIGIPFLNYPSHPNAYTLDEFKNGGYVYFYLSCAAEFLRSDDWDIATGTVTFNFVSQKGIPYTGKTQVKIPNFRLSSSTNGFTVGQQVIWFKPDFTSQ